RRSDAFRWGRWQHFSGRPFPVFPEQQGASERRRSRDADMGVAPAAETGVLAQIFDADMVPANPGVFAIHHHDLAVIAVVDPGGTEDTQELVALIEPGDLDAGLPELRPIPLGHSRAADVIIKQVYFDARFGALDQALRQFFAQRIVTHDVELHQKIVPGLLDP